MTGNPDQDVLDTKVLLEKQFSWIRSSFAEPYYKNDPATKITTGTPRLAAIQDKFDKELVQRGLNAKASKTPFKFPPRKPNIHLIKHCNHDSSCSSEDDLSDDEFENEDSAYEELERKKTHPWRLHDELWYNDKGEMNDGPVCRCSAKAKKNGIRHGIYPGEEKLPRCDPNTDNRDRLYHYRIVIKPLTNFTTKFPTVIVYDNHQYMFESFSVLSHKPVHKNYPPCKLIRFNIEYEMSLEEEEFPRNFTMRDLELFSKYVFKELLELEDLNWNAHNDEDGCPRYHLYPRFARVVEDDGKEFLSMHVILNYLLAQSRPLIDEQRLASYHSMTEEQWVDFAKQHKGMIVTYPGKKPCSIRVDQIDRDFDEKAEMKTGCSGGEDEKKEESRSTLDQDYPIIVHFGIRPPQLSYAGNPKYQKTWRDYVKYRHLLANKPKVSYEEKQMLLKKEEKLQEMRLKSDLKRDCTVVISSKNFYCTGIYCDLIQYCLMIPVLVCHLRFHDSLIHLEEHILSYRFKDRYLLQLALTHPSYRENFGMNADHARNALTNCGIRQPYYGDRKVHFTNTRKRGINMLINIMSRFGHNQETMSSINHNERLEFLGDAVVEFLTSIHLYHIFPDLEEGGLATYRAAIVQNQHLAVMAKNLQLNKYMLYAHGSDLCHDLELKHAMANCFEALIGALFLDGGIDVADKVFSETLFLAPHACPAEPNALAVGGAEEAARKTDEHGCSASSSCHDDHPIDEKVANENLILRDLWIGYKKHPIQMQQPNGDRHLIEKIPRLKDLHEFEKITGIEFTHIRLLARAFTHRSVGFNNLTLGSNQRMEFLGDTVLQLIASEYLYKYFPEHHEGHLSLLRSSLVNNKTQAVVCDDLGMTKFAIYNYAKGELKTKDRADLLEAFLGALYVDKGLEYCKTFCGTCFFPRLEHFIVNQDWNDPKSKLQQCCLTLRSFEGGEPDIPIYKVIESLGPTNTRVYKVAVYFRDKRLETGTGHSIQEAEMDAAANALKEAKELFPQLIHQKLVLERSVRQQDGDSSFETSSKRFKPDKRSSADAATRSSASPESSNSNDKTMDTANANHSEPNSARQKSFADLQSDSNGSCSSGSNQSLPLSAGGHKSSTRNSDRLLERDGGSRKHSDRRSDRSPERGSYRTDQRHANGSRDSKGAYKDRNSSRCLTGQHRGAPDRKADGKRNSDRNSVVNNSDDRKTGRDNRGPAKNHNKRRSPPRPYNQSVFSDDRARSTRHHSDRPSSRGSNHGSAPLNSFEIQRIYSQNINLNSPNE